MTFAIIYVLASLIIGASISYCLWEGRLEAKSLSSFIGCSVSFGLMWPIMLLLTIFDRK